MTTVDGVEVWQDGPGGSFAPTPVNAPSKIMLTLAEISDRHLWVVTPGDVRHAAEHCPFGDSLNEKRIKHSNLTGGERAHCGGEMVFSNSRIVINGLSGRYGPQSKRELDAVTQAFKASGYAIWSMGWDDDANRPAPFLGKLADPV